MKARISKPKTILEAIKDLQVFFEEDMWYAKENEWKTEEDMLKYLKGHFKICKDQIKRIQTENENNNIS